MPATPCDNDDDPHAPGPRLAWWATAAAVATSAATIATSAVAVRLAYTQWRERLLADARPDAPNGVLAQVYRLGKRAGEKGEGAA